MFNPQLTFDVLRENDASLAEYYVMGTVAYGIFLSPEELARQSLKLSDGDPCGTFPEQTHLEAVSSCIEKKWLETVTLERQRGDDILDIGTVDFTPEGFALYRRIINKIFDEDFVIGYENL